MELTELSVGAQTIELTLEREVFGGLEFALGTLEESDFINHNGYISYSLQFICLCGFVTKICHNFGSFDLSVLFDWGFALHI